ncbi:MAG: hypothetical protein KIT33_15275 [Candidatus Kapabacteria bacterium]|nr:hypothetical protein [Candidatus Kapabacteria bacterium]
MSYPKHQIGLGYSSFSASGLTYYLEINKYSALQVSLLPYYTSTSNNNLSIIALFGGEYHFNIFRTKEYRIFAFAASGAGHLERSETTFKIINDVEIRETRVDLNRIINFGTGAGLEYKINRQFIVSAGIGLMYQLSDKANFSEFWDRNPSGESFLGIGGSISFRYAF